MIPGLILNSLLGQVAGGVGTALGFSWGGWAGKAVTSGIGSLFGDTLLSQFQAQQPGITVEKLPEGQGLLGLWSGAPGTAIGNEFEGDAGSEEGLLGMLPDSDNLSMFGLLSYLAKQSGAFEETPPSFTVTPDWVQWQAGLDADAATQQVALDAATLESALADSNLQDALNKQGVVVFTLPEGFGGVKSTDGKNLPDAWMAINPSTLSLDGSEGSEPLRLVQIQRDVLKSMGQPLPAEGEAAVGMQAVKAQNVLYMPAKLEGTGLDENGNPLEGGRFMLDSDMLANRSSEQLQARLAAMLKAATAAKEPEAPAPAPSTSQSLFTPAIGGSASTTSSTHLASSQLNAQPHYAPVAHQVAEAVKMSMRSSSKGGEKEITVQLQPADMGRVEVRMQLGETNRVTMIADNLETMLMLAREGKSLERALTDSGMFDQGMLSFHWRGAQDQQGQQPWQLPGGLLAANDVALSGDVSEISGTLTETTEWVVLPSGHRVKSLNVMI